MQTITPQQARCSTAAIDRALDAGLFKALSDPTRALLFACLAKCGRPCSVTEIAACCSVDTSVVSRHLKALAEADLCNMERRGRSVLYSVRYAAVARTLRRAARAVETCRGGIAAPTTGGGQNEDHDHHPTQTSR